MSSIDGYFAKGTITLPKLRLASIEHSRGMTIQILCCLLGLFIVLLIMIIGALDKGVELVQLLQNFLFMLVVCDDELYFLLAAHFGTPTYIQFHFLFPTHSQMLYPQLRLDFHLAKIAC